MPRSTSDGVNHRISHLLRHGRTNQQMKHQFLFAPVDGPLWLIILAILALLGIIALWAKLVS
jgi:hypothetical protein